MGVLLIPLMNQQNTIGDKMNDLYCPKCGKLHNVREQWNQQLEKFESMIVCLDCGFTSFVEMYRQADFMDP